MNMQDRLRALVEPIVTDLGLELFDLEYSGATLTVTLERRPLPGRPRREQPSGVGGVGIDDITAVTRAVSRALDEADPIAGAYRLEVSSPGLERSLRVPAHFTWAVGQTVSVKTVPGFEAGRRLKGELTRADDTPEGSLDVVLDASGGQVAGDLVTIPYDQVDKARTVFEWGPEPKPTKPPKPTKATKSSTSAKKAATSKAATTTSQATKGTKPSKSSKTSKSSKSSPSASPSPATSPATNSTQPSTTNSKKVTAS